jgi:Spy/CpxP family protein refolding chaperone
VAGGVQKALADSQTAQWSLFMRKFVFVVMAAALTACNGDSTAPSDDLVMLEDAASLAYGAMDMADPGSHFLARLNNLPDPIKLSTEQRAQIRALIAAFVQATQADKEALTAIHQEARAARAAGASDAEVRAIFAQGDEIRRRLHVAEAQLHADILALLTPAQRAWLERPLVCRAEDIRLNEAQKTQITALLVAFESANRPDLDTIKAIFEQARTAYQAGASREEIAAILQQARAPMERVRAARLELEAAIRALLTPAQIASGCFSRIGPNR